MRIASLSVQEMPLHRFDDPFVAHNSKAGHFRPHFHKCNLFVARNQKVPKQPSEGDAMNCLRFPASQKTLKANGCGWPCCSKLNGWKWQPLTRPPQAYPALQLPAVAQPQELR